jgi:hypothetical protein
MNCDTRLTREIIIITITATAAVDFIHADTVTSHWLLSSARK